MKKFLLLILSLFLFLLPTSCTIQDFTGILPDDDVNNEQKPEEEYFNDYGFEVIEIELSELLITEDGIYTSYQEVGAYIYIYEKLPSNYRRKSEFNRADYTPQNKLSCGGDVFYNRERILPIADGRTYTECDIDYTGGSRNAKRIVFSSDKLIFYTSNHYSTFKILRFINA